MLPNLINKIPKNQYEDKNFLHKIKEKLKHSSKINREQSEISSILSQLKQRYK